MSNESIKKVVVSIIAFFFISTAAAPVIQSQLTNRLLSQQVTATETLARVRVPLNIVQPQGTADKSSQQNPPAPLGDTPPTIHLPTSQVTMLVFLNSTISYFRTQLQNVPSGYEVTNGFYTGWCSDYTHYIYTNTAYQTYLYSSYDTNLPPQDYHQNWSKVNYILNHKQGTNWHQIQYAILYILDFGNQGLNATGWAMVNAAVQYGGDYVPHSGDIIAIIGDPGVNVQRQIFELTVPSYTLTTTPDGSGTITKDPDHTYYTYGQVVTLTAAPNPGWSFSYWSGDASGSNPVTTVTMNGNRAVTAHFTQNEYTLSISVIGSGSVTRNPSQGTYHYGDVVQLTATADTGWTFDHWSGDLTGSTNPASLTVTGNMAVTATFILTGDLEPPLVEIAKPSDGVYVFDQYILPAKKPIVIQGVTIQVNASDNQSGVKKVQFYVDGILKGNDSTAPYTYNWTDLRSGMRQVKAVAYDNAGNSRAVEISVMKWRFHPILALLLFYVISPLLRNLKNWIHDHMPAQTST